MGRRACPTRDEPTLGDEHEDEAGDLVPEAAAGSEDVAAGEP
ncbi:hypothetical protein [Myxococcus sp. RHSTA-1-4]|nr:hypothetical protein [Myxococcus sp. RHSTA-1-4]